MIYTDAELKEKIYEMLKDFETEVVEFKEANNTNERLTFLDIYELTMEKCRMVPYPIDLVKEVGF